MSDFNFQRWSEEYKKKRVVKLAEQREKHKCYCTRANGPDPDCLSCEGTGFDTDYKDVAVCPWCGAEQSTDDQYEARTYETECDECGKPIEMELEYNPSWTVKRRETP
jgi:hypothetical protein